MILHFENIGLLNLMWVLIPIILLLIYSLSRKKESLKKFTGGLINKYHLKQLKSYFSASLFTILSLFFLILALSRPSWSEEERLISKKGRDVVFLVDVSRSMLADDLVPNRLERAKLAIIDAIQILEGDRVALIAFAGSSVVKTPLTNDYSFFSTSVERLNIQSVSRGGSLIGDAIRFANKSVLDESLKAYKDIILITDGEDHESFPIEAAIEADKDGIRIIAIGLGDENKGHRIPGKEGFMKFEGEEVWSRLDAQTLRSIASSTKGGQYLNVSTGSFDLAEIYGSLIKNQKNRSFEDDLVVLYDEKFQLFLFLSICSLFLSFIQSFLSGSIWFPFKLKLVSPFKKFKDSKKDLDS